MMGEVGWYSGSFTWNSLVPTHLYWQHCTSAMWLSLILPFSFFWSKVNSFILHKSVPRNFHNFVFSTLVYRLLVLHFYSLGSEPQFVPCITHYSVLIGLWRHIYIYWIFILNRILLNQNILSIRVIICTCCSLNQVNWKA